MKSRSQLQLFVNSAHVQDLLNYCTVPLLLPSSSVHPWGFKDFSTTTGRTNLAYFPQICVLCLPCAALWNNIISSSCSLLSWLSCLWVFSFIMCKSQVDKRKQVVRCLSSTQGWLLRWQVKPATGELTVKPFLSSSSNSCLLPNWGLWV